MMFKHGDSHLTRVTLKLVSSSLKAEDVADVLEIGSPIDVLQALSSHTVIDTATVTETRTITFRSIPLPTRDE